MIYLDSFWLGFSSSIIGFLATNFIKDYQQQKRFATALSAELKVLMNQYNKIGGPLLQEQPDGTFIPFTTNIDDDFFTIYNKNADKLGFFDNELISEIVSLYTDAKGFVCSIKTWSNSVDKQQSLDYLKAYHAILEKQRSDVFLAAEDVICKLNSISLINHTKATFHQITWHLKYYFQQNKN